MYPFFHHLLPLGPIIAHFQAILEHGGYWVIAAASILESIPLLGTIIPGHTIVIIGGFFARLGFLNIYIVGAIAAVGSITGDLIGYFWEKIRSVSDYELGQIFPVEAGKVLIKPERSLVASTGKALFVGRFNPVARCFIPFMVGAGGGKWKTFWIYDIIAGICWAAISVSIGYVFGASYHLIAAYIGEFTTIGIAIAILIGLGYYFINSRRHLFTRHDFYLMFASIFSMLIFFKSVQDIFSTRPIFVNLDVAVNIDMARTCSRFLSELPKS